MSRLSYLRKTLFLVCTIWPVKRLTLRVRVAFLLTCRKLIAFTVLAMLHCTLKLRCVSVKLWMIVTVTQRITPVSLIRRLAVRYCSKSFQQVYRSLSSISRWRRKQFLTWSTSAIAWLVWKKLLSLLTNWCTPVLLSQPFLVCRLVSMTLSFLMRKLRSLIVRSKKLKKLKSSTPQVW